MGQSKTIQSANRLRFHRLMFVVIIGAFLLIFITVGPLLFGGKEVSPIATDTKLTEVEEPKIDENSDEYFQQQLAEGSISALTIRLAQLQEESGLPVVLRLQNIARQIALGERLLEMDIDQSTRDGAIEGSLLAINRREALAIKHEMYSEDTVLQAEEFANKPGVAGHYLHADLAATTISLAAIERFLFEDDTDKRIIKRIKALELFKQAAWRDNESVLLSEKLNELIGMIQDHGFMTESNPFIRAYLEAFSGSKSLRVKELSDDLSLVLSQSQIGFANLFVVDPEIRKQNVRDFSLQVQRRFSESDIHPAVVATAIHKLEHLIQIGQVDEVEFLKSQLSEYVNRSPDATMKMAELDRLFEIATSSFSPAGILKSDGQPVDDVDLNQRTIMLFLSHSQQGETAHIIKTVGKSLGARYRAKDLRFALVYVRENKSQLPPKDMLDLAQKTGLEIWYLDKSSASGRAFLSSFPIVKTPYCVVLNKGYRVVALDSPAAIAGQVVFEN